jgi:hypothetical protein
MCNCLLRKLEIPPVDVPVDAVLIIGVLVLEIVGQPGDDREFLPGLRIEIGITHSSIDRRVPDDEVG